MAEAVSVGVIGTAGHVDHGKTALVGALTGTDTDRLPEEKRRGISIELGFAELLLPSGHRAGIIDVPGHERFVKTMVAGSHGIDVCLLVVAADEGVMPQTREHLDVAMLLGVRRAVVALSRADLAPDPEWRAMVRGDIAALMRGTPLAGAPMAAVSVRTGEGLDTLRGLLEDALEGIPARPLSGAVHLPIDRVFSVAGFGTIVTGTLTSGTIAADDRLEIQPGGLAVRVRGVESHGRVVERALPGSRTAVNLVGAQRGDIPRGAVLGTPGAFAPVSLLAVRLHALEHLPGDRPLAHNQRLHLHLGTEQSICRVRLLEGSEVGPGQGRLALLHLEKAIVARRGDRFILRSYSPVTTVGGGVILDLQHSYRRNRPDDLRALELREAGAPTDLARAALERASGPLDAAALVAATGLDQRAVSEALVAMRDQGLALPVDAEGHHWMTPAGLAQLRTRAREALTRYHQAHPMRSGMTRQELRQAALPGSGPRAAAAAIAALVGTGDLRARGEHLALCDFTPAPPDHLRAVALLIQEQIGAAGLQPPALATVLVQAGADPASEETADLVAFLLEQGHLVRVDATLSFGSDAIRQAIAAVRQHLTTHGTLSVAEMRDLLGITRKHAVPLAEYLDGIRVTRREGDVRRLA